MKILLVRPRPDAETIGLQHLMICEPLELEYLAATVAGHGHDVVIVDMILERQPIDHFIREHRPEVLGVTAYITHVAIALDYCRAARRLLPGCRNVVGGVHAEVVPEDFHDDAVDFIVRGNPLTTFRELIKCLAAGLSVQDLPGLWRLGAPPFVRETAFRHPHPDRSLVARYRARYYYLFHNPCALIKTSFGCPQECTFCFCREVTGGAYFARELDDVIAELSGIPEQDIYIVDDNFLVSRPRVLAFCAAVQQAGIKKRYLIYGRADFIAANEDVIAAFRRAGLRAVIVGLESCRQDDLDRFNKRSDVAANEAAVRILTRHGVDCYATMILGRDWGLDDFARLGRWLRGLGLIYVNLQPFTPLPGTALFASHEDALRVPRREFAAWDLAHLVVAPTVLSPAVYYRQILALYRAVTLRPAVIWRLAMRYGLRANLRLLVGTRRIARQYEKLARAAEGGQ